VSGTIEGFLLYLLGAREHYLFGNTLTTLENARMMLESQI
jgi:hypothetical protein